MSVRAALFRSSFAKPLDSITDSLELKESIAYDTASKVTGFSYGDWPLHALRQSVKRFAYLIRDS